jgi:predicted lipoprotein with Yx(FWY)xxD motif
MNRRFTALAAGLSLLALAACGSDDNSTSQAAANPTEPAASSTVDTGTATTPSTATAQTVAVQEIDGFGPVLVDSTGMPLYAADEEADGQVRCVDSCTSFWMPLEPGDATMSDVPGVGTLDVIERPDGTEQATADGRPLYTFVQDSPGEVTGDGFSDDFGDQHLTWHVVRVESAAGASSSVTTDASGSAGSSDPDYGGIYDYGD